MTGREPAALRLLDVLLEEQLGAAADRSPAEDMTRRRPVWAAAALLLLGASVVTAVAWLQAPTPAPTSGQDPAPTRVSPKDLDAFVRLLDDVTGLTLGPTPPPPGVPVLGQLPLLGNLFRNQGTAGDGSVPDHALPVAVRIDDPRELDSWLPRLRQCRTTEEQAVPLDPLRLDLKDHRFLEGSLSVDGTVLVVHTDHGQLLLRPPAPLRDARQAAKERADALWTAAMRRQNGIADTEAELLQLPTDRTTLDLAADVALVRAACERFPALTQLDLTRGAPDARIFAVLASRPSLRWLRLPADRLVDADLRALGATSITQLALVGPPTAAPGAFAALRAVTRLTLEPPPLPAHFDLRALLAAMPALVDLEVLGDLVAGDTLLDALAATKVQSLAIGGPSVDAALLRRVAGLPQLRRLDLRRMTVAAGEFAALATMTRLRELAFAQVVWVTPGSSPTAIDRNALAELLPRCAITDAGVGPPPK